MKTLGLSKTWFSILEDYEILTKIGQGSFGIVVEAKCRSSGLIVAIKCVQDFDEYEYDCVKLLREI